MLTEQKEEATYQSHTAIPSGTGVLCENAEQAVSREARTLILARALRVEWLGQMAASMCWIGSVLAYGISSAGDWLQLAAASAWLIANIASLVGPEAD